MQAVILAGGLGTRLRPLTETVPKPMVPVNDEPFLVHQLRMLTEQGITNIVLLTGYMGEVVEDYFGDGSNFGAKLSYSQEPEPLGTGGALKLAQPLLEDSFMVLFGDSYLPVDYPEVGKTLLDSTWAGLIVAYDNSQDTDVENNVALDEDGNVVLYQKGGGDDRLRYVESGVLAFRRQVLDLIAPDTVVSLENEIYPQLIAAGQLGACPTEERFYDIGTPDRLEDFRRILA
ncbi:MAG: nucleotidyltransferase family protein [Acidimicrobiales bacterium]